MPPVVEPVVVDMIDKLSGLGADDLPVHCESGMLGAFDGLKTADGVECPRGIFNGPREFRQAPIIRFVNYCIFSAC